MIICALAAIGTFIYPGVLIGIVEVYAAVIVVVEAGDGVFAADAYDTAPSAGRRLAVKGEKLTLLVSDLYGNISVWEY